MVRSLVFRKGLTLLELLIAMSIFSMIVLTASSLLISFKKFYIDFVERQSEIEGVSLGLLEEMSNNVRVATRITATTDIPKNPVPDTDYTSTLQLYYDANNPATPENYDDDSYHSYVWVGEVNDKGNITVQDYAYGAGFGAERHVSKVVYFLPVLTPDNKVGITISVKPSDDGAIQTFATNVVARPRPAEGI
ncbi:MAG: prepilin-type N-terminal cleavage/methylation domain-containing protein [Candidatus Omnitrophica bacterium]|nr:prepilin-type N-terminal cleavage/methylation domain-containing protein [Candidatus Omnitrophota bacterium]